MRRLAYALTALFVIALAAIAGLYWYGTVDDASTGSVASDAPPHEKIELGKYLSIAANCAGCHTTPGGMPYAGGTPVSSPFGTFYGPNITPSKQHGIGTWSANDFWQALHNGKTPQGRLLYPAFPYTEYTRISRSDSDAIHAYLMSLEPSGSPSRAHDLRAPYNRQFLLGLWRGLFFRPGVYAEVEDRSPLWNRGSYLVNGVGHCASCHTPRGQLAAARHEKGLQGSLIMGLDWYATPLTGEAATGLGDWTEADIMELLRTGLSRHGVATGPMAEVVSHSTQYLDDEDSRAIAVYLKSLPAAPAPEAATSDLDAQLMSFGSDLYKQHCVMCHQADGKGIFPFWPPLAANPSVIAADPSNVIQSILKGGYAPATVANPRPHGMPPFHRLSDTEIAALATYIRNSWNNSAGEVRGFEVGRKR